MWLYSYELYGQRAKGLYVQYPKDWLLFFWLVFMVVQGIFTSLNFLFIHLDPIVTPRQLPLLEAYHLEYQIAGQDSDNWGHCTMCCLGSIFSFQLNKLRHIFKFEEKKFYIFVPACLVGKKTWFSGISWFLNSKFWIYGSFWPILSIPYFKNMFLVP